LGSLDKEQLDILLEAAMINRRQITEINTKIEALKQEQMKLLRSTIEDALYKADHPIEKEPPKPPITETTTNSETSSTTPSGEESKEKEKAVEKPLAGVTIARGNKSILLQHASDTEQGKHLQKQMLEYLDLKLKMELDFLTAIEAVFLIKEDSKRLLKENPELLTCIKNSLLDLDVNKYGILIENLSKGILLPVVQRPKGMFYYQAHYHFVTFLYVYSLCFDFHR
jgi:hypothetical protein